MHLSQTTRSLIMLKNSASGQNLPRIQLLEKAEPCTYLERSLVIHGSVCVSKPRYEHSLEPAFQDGRHAEPLQWELRNREQRGQMGAPQLSRRLGALSHCPWRHRRALLSSGSCHSFWRSWHIKEHYCPWSVNVILLFLPEDRNIWVGLKKGTCNYDLFPEKSKQPVLRSSFWCVMPKSIFSQELTLVGVTTKIHTLCSGMWNPITEMNRTTYANTWSVWLRFNKDFPWENRVGPLVLIKAEQGLGPRQYFFSLTHGLKPMTIGTCPEGEKKNKEFGGFDCFLQCLKGCWPTGNGPRGRVLEQKEQDWARCVFLRGICPIWCMTFATQASNL